MSKILISGLYLCITIGCIVLAIKAQNPVNMKLFASLGIICGAFANSLLSSQEPDQESQGD